MLQKIGTIAVICLLVFLGAALVYQHFEIKKLIGNSDSVSKQLATLSSTVKTDFTDWTGRLDSIQSGYSDIKGTIRQLQSSVNRSIEISGNLQGTVNAISTVLTKPIGTSVEAYAAIDRLGKFGDLLESYYFGKGNGIPKSLTDSADKSKGK